MAHPPTMFRGGITNTTGACPCCGAEVARAHAWSNRHARDVYDCPSCGTFTYGTTPPEPAEPCPG